MIQVNILILIVIAVAAVILGYRFRGSRFQSLKKRIHELEQEMRADYADILNLRKK